MPFVNVSITRLHPVLLLVMGCALGLNSAVAAGQLDSLLANSPFGSAKSSGQPADAGTQPLEFRGVLEENGQQIFSIYDTATKRSRWVSLNAASEDFVVKSYDAGANSISLEHHGRVLALALKSGPKVAQTAQMPNPGGMQTAVNGQPAQIMPNGAMGKGPEAQRLQQIAEEIRRRRALRQQAPQMPMPTPNGASSSGGPMPLPGAGTGSGPIPLPGMSTSPGPMPMPNPNPGSSTGPIPSIPPKS